MPERRLWTLVARHPDHTDPTDRRHARHGEGDIDDVADFRRHLIRIARQIAPQHTGADPDAWLGQWELEVYRDPDDLDWVRCFRWPPTEGALE